MLPGQVAYMAQYAFTTNVTPQVEQALQELLAQEPVGLIWDLRDNGGGSMDTTRDVLSYFIEDGLLFTAETQGGRRREFVAQGGGPATDIPLVVLIDEGTYSAAETAAAAIKERGRGVLIGGATYGKGSILTTVPIGQDCMLQMTVAKWLSPSGEWYGGQGVPPDIVVDDDENTEGDEVLDFAVDYIQELTHSE
jgi:carboxyl-terminal processing protease